MTDKIDAMQQAQQGMQARLAMMNVSVPITSCTLLCLHIWQHVATCICTCSKADTCGKAKPTGCEEEAG